MNTPPPSGGSAFPRTGFYTADVLTSSEFDSTSQDGMTLRDYFAGQALANGRPVAVCYEIADAMIAARVSSTVPVTGSQK